MARVLSLGADEAQQTAEAGLARRVGGKRIHPALTGLALRGTVEGERIPGLRFIYII